MNFTALPKPVIAEKLKKLIDDTIEADQGNSYRALLRQTLPLAEDAYREDHDPFRSHLGFSFLGRECSRELWYIFRWHTVRKSSGRMLRLFNRGHVEEARVIALFLMVGCEVWSKDENGNQFRISTNGGHSGGSCDIIVRGIPDIPEVPLLTEIKTHKDDIYSKVASHGVRSAKIEHYIQMQLYMKGLGLLWALYVAVNKDDDDIHFEIVPYNPEMAAQQTDRAKLLVLQTVPPEKVSKNPTWWKCKFCDQRGVCQEGEAPAVNCRTCTYSRVIIEGGWQCVRHGKMLTKEEQLAGCSDYRRI